MEKDIKKILIIEDDKLLSRALELKFTHEGFLVKTLPNGDGFLSLLEKENFSLITTDLIMPKVDGFEVLKIAKEKNIKTPIIVLTNLGQVEDESNVRSLGAKEFFVKSSTPLSKIVSYVKENV